MTRRTPARWCAGPPDNGFKPWERHSDQRLLDGLGLTIGHIEQYRVLFLDDRLRGKHSIHKDHQWPELPYPWDDHLVLRHLAGLKTIGLFWARKVRTLMLDFDAHEPRTPEEARELAGKVVRSISGEWTLYQSSDTGGVRAVAFLDSLVPRETAQAYLVAQLRQAGFTPEPGVLEARMDKKTDRLPFGCGSMLIDNTTLEPILGLTLAETIEFVTDRRATCYIEASEVIRWCRDNPEIQPSDEAQRYREQLPRLLKEGLHAGISTYHALQFYNWYLRARQGLSEAEAVAFLKDWIRQNHNNHSQRINAGRWDEIDRQTEQTGRRFDESLVKSGIRQGRPKSSKRPNLNQTELRRLLLEYHLGFKELMAAAGLLPYCKVKLKWGELKESNIYVPRYCGKQGTPYYVPRNSWCGFAPIPVKLLEALPGFGSANPRLMMDLLVRAGLFLQKRKHHAASNTCRDYWVLFPFVDDGSEPVQSFEVAIVAELGEDEVRRRFSPHFARNILQEARKWAEEKESYCVERSARV